MTTTSLRRALIWAAIIGGSWLGALLLAWAIWHLLTYAAAALIGDQ